MSHRFFQSVLSVPVLSPKQGALATAQVVPRTPVQIESLVVSETSAPKFQIERLRIGMDDFLLAPVPGQFFDPNNIGAVQSAMVGAIGYPSVPIEIAVRRVKLWSHPRLVIRSRSHGRRVRFDPPVHAWSTGPFVAAFCVLSVEPT